jgi:hypothetical protein
MTTNQDMQKTIAAAPAVSAGKVILWTLLFQLAWHHARIPLLFSDLAMWDSDDFLRLHEVRNWMAGAGWFDLSVPRMAAMPGTAITADMHWSRLVDVPIAGLIGFFDLFVHNQLAEILAIIVWPCVLLLATVFTLIAVTEKLFPSANRLLVVIFAVTCITALVEFAPGRIDHHSVQILFFSLTLLGLVSADRPWGHYLVGASIAFSVTIGLDVFLMLVFILGWLGFEWAVGLDRNGKGLVRTAIAMAVAALLLFPLSVSPAKWFAPACDAFSIVYLAVLGLIAGAFVVLAALTSTTRFNSPIQTAAMRIACGTILAGLCLGVLYLWFPQCRAGPMSLISPELDRVWLSKVVEAKGLMAYLASEGFAWIAVPAYVLAVIIAGAVLMRRHRLPTGFFALWGSLVICFFLGFIQVRAYRVGIFAGIPICVMVTQYAGVYFAQRFKGEKLVVMISSGLVALFLTTPFWLAMGNLVFPNAGTGLVAPNTGTGLKTDAQLPAWRNEPPELICNRRSQYDVLKSLPAGRVLNDLNSGPSILVFTDHSILAGNYHRNGEAIIDTQLFFGSHDSEAEKVIRHWNVDYVAFCAPFSAPTNPDREIMGIRIIEGRYPEWLQPVSGFDDRLIVAKVLP